MIIFSWMIDERQGDKRVDSVSYLLNALKQWCSGEIKSLF